MRRIVTLLVVFVVLGPGTALSQGLTEEPVGSLAQLMRGIMFPNGNKLFDVQAQEPGGELPTMTPEVRDAVSALMGPASSRYATTYRGWPEVEGAAVALADSAKLAMMEGRLCDNGMPAPVDRADYIEGARLLEESAIKVLHGAQQQDYEAVSDAINYVTESCSHCHRTYRDGPDARNEPRCLPSN
jgi:hypothetical protein